MLTLFLNFLFIVQKLYLYHIVLFFRLQAVALRKSGNGGDYPPQWDLVNSFQYENMKK